MSIKIFPLSVTALQKMHRYLTHDNYANNNTKKENQPYMFIIKLSHRKYRQIT